MSIYLNIAPCGWGKCSFCAYNAMSDYKRPSWEQLAEDLLKELAKVTSNKQAYVKVFNGGNFFGSEMPEDIRSFILGFLENKGCKKLRVENRVDQIPDKKYIEQLVADGWDLTVSWGVETLSAEVRESLNKGISQQQIKDTLQWASSVVIKNLVYLMAGLPNCNNGYVEDMKTTLATLKEWEDQQLCTVNQVVILTYVPMKGSQLYDQLWKTNKHRVISKDEWQQVRDLARNTFEGRVTFETYHWRYLHGRTYSEVWKKG